MAAPGFGTGREKITFQTQNTLPNGLYQLTLVGSGGNAIRDIAGNTPAGGDIVIQFAVFNPNNITGVFVGPASFVTDATKPQGDRANPFPTIGAALAAASVGERLEVLPGVYTEAVTLQPLVSLVSADPASTNTSFVPGNALNTIIRAPATAGPTTNITVQATNLQAFTSTGTSNFVFQTEIAGFTIASPLVGDPALGSINPDAFGLLITNSDILVDKDYFIDAGNGIWVTTTGATSLAPQIINNGVIGNINGLVINDAGGSNAASVTNVINNTFAFNTNGILALNTDATSSEQAYIANNIFWQNHDQSLTRFGWGVTSTVPNKLLLNNNMFSGNGQSDLTSSRRGEQHRQRIQSSAAGPHGRGRRGQPGQLHGLSRLRRPA